MQTPPGKYLGSKARPQCQAAKQMDEYMETITTIQPYGNYKPVLSIQRIHETDKVLRQETIIDLRSTQNGARTA